jgi:hypothetical protein
LKCSNMEEEGEGRRRWRVMVIAAWQAVGPKGRREEGKEKKEDVEGDGVYLWERERGGGGWGLCLSLPSLFRLVAIMPPPSLPPFCPFHFPPYHYHSTIATRTPQEEEGGDLDTVFATPPGGVWGSF